MHRCITLSTLLNLTGKSCCEGGQVLSVHMDLGRELPVYQNKLLLYFGPCLKTATVDSLASMVPFIKMNTVDYLLTVTGFRHAPNHT